MKSIYVLLILSVSTCSTSMQRNARIIPLPSKPTISATFISEDRTSGGDWRAYGKVGQFLYPDGATGWFVDNLDKTYFKGVGTLLASGQFMAFGGLCTFDQRAPLRRTAINESGIAMCGNQTIDIGNPWPANARFAGGLYNRTRCEPCVPPWNGTTAKTIAIGAIRLGLRLDSSRTIRLYLNDMNSAQFTSPRTIKVDVYEETDTIYVDAPSLGTPSYEPGALLISKIVRDFNNTGVYVGLTVTGPIVIELSAIEPHLFPDGTTIVDTNGLVVLQGVFLD